MQRKTILFALAAVGTLVGGVAITTAATNHLNASPTCVDDGEDLGKTPEEIAAEEEADRAAGEAEDEEDDECDADEKEEEDDD